MKKLKHIYLDFSSIDLYRSCPRKFYLQLVETFIPKGTTDESTEATFKGRMIHEALDAKAMGRSPRDAMMKLVKDSSIKHIHTIDPDKSGSVHHMRKLLAAYLKRYKNDNLQIVSTEARFEYPLTPWCTYVGNVDKVARLGNKTVIVDHKTSSSLKSWVEPQVSISDQFTGYIALAKHNGIVTDTLVVDGVSTALKALKDGDGLFVRYNTVRTKDQILDWETRMKWWATRIKEDLETNKWNTNQPKACTSYGGRCSFFDICAGAGLSGINILRNDFMKNPKPWHSFKIVWEDQ